TAAALRRVMDLACLDPWAGLPPGEDVVIAGIPYDGSAVYRRGAAQAPARLRELSKAVPPVTEQARRMLMTVHDLGDLDLGPAVEQGWQKVADELAAVAPGAFL